MTPTPRQVFSGIRPPGEFPLLQREQESETGASSLMAAESATCTPPTETTIWIASQSLTVGDLLELQLVFIAGTGFDRPGGRVLEFSWYQDGVLRPQSAGNSNAAFVKQSVALGDAGSWTCRIRGECGTFTTDPLVITVT